MRKPNAVRTAAAEGETHVNGCVTRFRARPRLPGLVGMADITAVQEYTVRLEMVDRGADVARLVEVARNPNQETQLLSDSAVIS